MPEPRVYVAFKRGSWHNLSETAVEAITWSPLVHSEVRIDSASYAAYEDLYPCFQKTQAGGGHPKWVIIPIGISNVGMAQAFLNEIVNARLPYRFPWECVVPQSILKKVETDLDCCRPHTWGSVFCSQAALLFLRRCALANILQIPNPHMLFQVDSNGTSPARLYNLLRAMQNPPQQRMTKRKIFRIHSKPTQTGTGVLPAI